MKIEKAIILVAGRGNRLRPLTDSMPKCLTEVNGESILENALKKLSENGIKETILVVGYLKEKIKGNIGNEFNDMKINYVDNDIYDKTNTSYSLWLAIKDLDEDVLILEGDVFFEDKLLKDFLNDKRRNLTIVERYKKHLDGSFVDIDENSKRVLEWIHKKDRSDNFTIEDKYKTVNIHKFSSDFLKEFLIPTLKNYSGVDRKEPIESVLRDILKAGGNIFVFETLGRKWFEIDNLKELKMAEEIFRNKKLKKKSLDEIRGLHGGYWRYPILDFHYLVNCHFPTKELYDKITEKLPSLVENYPSTQRVIAALLSKWKDRDYFNQNNLIVTNGSSEAIMVLNQIIKRVSVPIPTFNEYVELPKEKLNLFLVPEENRFRLDVDELIEEIKKSGSEFAVICNPNNPVGNIVPREDIIKLLEIGINLIVDEAFIDFSVEDSVEDLVKKYGNLIIVKTLTKTMGLAGLRLGYILTTNKDIKDKIRKILPIWNINSVAEYFIEIFPEFEEDYWNSIKRVKEDRENLLRKLKNIDFLEPYETKSNFIFCKTRISSRRLAEDLYDKYNIILRSELNQKILKSDNYVRIAVRRREENDGLIKALKEISS